MVLYINMILVMILDGTDILARYETPNYDYGDLGTLKVYIIVRFLLEQKEL